MPQSGVSDCQADPWEAVANPLAEMVELLEDSQPPVVKSAPGDPDVLFFDDVFNEGDEPIDWQHLDEQFVDIVVRVEDRFVGNSVLAPYRIEVEIVEPDDSVVRSYRLELDGPLGKGHAHDIYHPWSVGSYENRAFYYYVTHAPSAPGDPPEDRGLDLSALSGDHVVRVTVWDLSSLQANTMPEPETYSVNFGP